ncbi:hypothetical protein ATO46_12220 [Aeromonas schubertii]|nr:hypothetical protein ATO46_12220 [Aeromonas schubertii]
METNNKIILMLHTINQIIYSYTSQLLMIKVTNIDASYMYLMIFSNKCLCEFINNSLCPRVVSQRLA